MVKGSLIRRLADACDGDEAKSDSRLLGWDSEGEGEWGQRKNEVDGGSGENEEGWDEQGVYSRNDEAGKGGFFDITQKFKRTAGGKEAQFPIHKINKRSMNMLMLTRNNVCGVDLPVGVLVKDAQFTLYNSVVTLQIMDPKMDSGLLPAEECEYDILQGLSGAQVVWIMDKLFALEMAWQMGYPLTQATFSCHYIYALLSREGNSELEEIQFHEKMTKEARQDIHLKVLRAYCIGVIKCTQLVRDGVRESHFYENEDFTSNLYGRDLLTHISVREIEDLLEVTKDELDEYMNCIEASDTIKAIKYRIQFRLAYIRALSSRESVWVDMWNGILRYVNGCRDTHGLGEVYDKSFSRHVQSRLSSISPPRAIVKIEFDEAVNQFTALCEDCMLSHRIVDFEVHDVVALKMFILHFNSTKPDREAPLVYARACLGRFLFRQGVEGFERMIRYELDTLLLPEHEALMVGEEPGDQFSQLTLDEGEVVNIPLSPKGFMVECVIERFVKQANYISYGGLYRTLIQNPTRQRRCFASQTLIGLDVLQECAEKLENTSQAFISYRFNRPLSNWVYMVKLQVMEYWVQLGFEQDLYLNHELYIIYGVWKWICELRIFTYDSIIQNHTNRIELLKSVNKAEVTWRTMCVESSRDFARQQLNVAMANFWIMEALNSIYFWLARLGFFRPDYDPLGRTATPATLDPVHAQFELRFKAFLKVKNPLLPQCSHFTQVPRLRLVDLDETLVHSPGYMLPLLIGEWLDSISQAQSYIRLAKQLGVDAARCRSVQTIWEKDINGKYACCVYLAVNINRLRDAWLKYQNSPSLSTSPFPLQLHVLSREQGYHRHFLLPKFILPDDLALCAE